MIKLTTQEARHIESTLEYLVEILNLLDEPIVPEDLGPMALESLEIIRSVNVYKELEILEPGTIDE